MNNPETESQVRAFGYDISIRGMVVIILVLTTCVMSAFGEEIKEPLYTLVASAVGWYFGQKKGTS
jgi:hypothetical protein